MLRIALCDDTVDVLSQTRTLLEQWKENVFPCHIEVFDNGDDLISAHKSAPFDIMILDIVMPLLNGIETALEIRQFDKSTKIVFLTSAPEFAVESYSVKASNYLLKPVQSDKLYACMEELFQELKHKSKTISIRSASNIYRVKLENIEYVEAQNKYVQFHLGDGRTISSIQPLYSYEDELTLEDGFYRCHRSYIVNIQFVNTFNQKEVHMQNGSTIPISRNNAKEFESAYFEVFFGKAGE